MSDYQVPGVYLEEVLALPEPAFLTAVPVFLGYTQRGAAGTPTRLSLWPQFAATFGDPAPNSYLAYAVRGFFENGGLVCYVIPLDQTLAWLGALRQGLASAEMLDYVDLVGAPDLLRPADKVSLDAVAAGQLEILDHCRRLGDRFAILDTPPTTDPSVDDVLEQRNRLKSEYGALYYPWVLAPGIDRGSLYVPACGHIAGIYARSDQQAGVHKAPANERIEGILDVQAAPSQIEQQRLYQQGVNYIQPLKGRGLRVWGARTLSDEPDWRYINVRRLFLTVGRWLTRFMAELPFEPNNARLWARIVRELTAYFETLFRQGALKGDTPDQAFYVACDAATNPPEAAQAGMVIAEIGLAPAVPGEFIKVRITHGASGVTMTTGTS